MGRNLLLNVADHGFSVVGLSSDPCKACARESQEAYETMLDMIRGDATQFMHSGRWKRPGR